MKGLAVDIAGFEIRGDDALGNRLGWLRESPLCEPQAARLKPTSRAAMR